ncbi:MAG TPA: tRNA pseudouridine(55) synthase TruB [Candidatus Flavonifractor intestinipullorum]|uniref:tRNA pseudouridine synthase B n=1 Tax=Candidatus Flavonifractor intestinipullorum TaxID=2838587 RepID=A0A9D2MC09_9FIRM|nr:tRNA pseudouridine(55) synthase TruB [Candidatus Flavonifractor intestinipullorum]
MANGILIIDKPQDWTSHDVVAKCRRVLHERRVGHAGTLDPMATGVLPVFVGRATRAVEFAAGSDKEYLAGLRLGVRTDTQDTTGTVLEERPVTADRAALEAVLEDFRGEILQVPPMYSALKVKGQKLYELARKGVEVERAPRPVTIHALEVVEQVSEREFRLRVACSKGTYVRTLCHDIGAKLGCGGAMYALRRVRACGFGEADALPLETVLTHPDPASLLRPVDAYFSAYPAVTVDQRRANAARNGAPFPQRGAEGTYRVYGPDGQFLLLGDLRKGRMTTIKSFFEV